LGLKADVKYIYKKGSFSQDVLIREAPPAPEAFGLDPKSTTLEVWTELFDVVAPKVTEVSLQSKPGESQLQDQLLDFGAILFGKGKAFSIGAADPQRISVAKRLENIGGRNVLIEAVRYSSALPHLQELPKAGVAALKPASEAPVVLAINKGRLLPLREKPLSGKQSIQVASAKTSNEKGFLVDKKIKYLDPGFNLDPIKYGPVFGK